MKLNTARLQYDLIEKTLLSVDPNAWFTTPSRCLPYWPLLPTSNACLSATHSVSPIHDRDNLTRLSLAGLLPSLLAKAGMLGIVRNGCVQINPSQMHGLLWNCYLLTFTLVLHRTIRPQLMMIDGLSIIDFCHASLELRFKIDLVVLPFHT